MMNRSATSEIYDEIPRWAEAVRRAAAGTIIGRQQTIDALLQTLLCDGHALILGVPGLAKTLMVRTLASATDLHFRRIQFTPDLMPSDITGTDVLRADSTDTENPFRFVQGPLFGNLILGDEINRSPPKTQAALLEAMEERQVTVAGRTHCLPKPFCVLATRNPIEQEGTYPLPEAQLDRFLIELRLDYPAEEQEFALLRSTCHGRAELPAAVSSTVAIEEMQRAVRAVPIADHVIHTALRIVRNSRPTTTASSPIRQWVHWGAGPRAGQALLHFGQAIAALQQAPCVLPEHIEQAAEPVLRHRLRLTYHAESEGMTPGAVIEYLLKSVSA